MDNLPRASNISLKNGNDQSLQYYNFHKRNSVLKSRYDFKKREEEDDLNEDENLNQERWRQQQENQGDEEIE